MLNEIKPFFTLFVSTVVGFLVAHGTLDQTSSTGVTQSMNDLIGGAILIVTAISALTRYVIKHPIAPVKEVSTPVVQPAPAPDQTPVLDTLVTQPVADTAVVG